MYLYKKMGLKSYKTRIILLGFMFLLVLLLITFVIAEVISGVITLTTIESNNDIGTYSSIALDSNGSMHISYQDITNTGLRYCNNTAGGNWSCTSVISTGNIGLYSQIAIDSNDKEHIACYEATSGDLYYCNNTAGSWSCKGIDTTNNVGAFPSIAIDTNNKVHISETDNTLNALRYCNNTALDGSWSCTSVETGNLESSIAIDSDNIVHISHYYGSNPYILRYCNNTANVWTCRDLDSQGAYSGIGRFSSLAIDSDKIVHISYANNTGGNLKYCNNSGGTWSCIMIIDTESPGYYTSIAIDSNNKEHIIHYESFYKILSYCNNTAGSWSCKNITYAPQLDWLGGYPYGRALAIKQGRLSDSTSFANSILGVFYNQSDLAILNITFPRLHTFAVNLTTPINNTNTTIKTPEINFTAIGSSSIYDCILYFNNTNVGSNSSVLNNTLTNITTNILLSDYNWAYYVNCTGGLVTINNSQIRKLRIDTTGVNVTILSPLEQNYNYNQSIPLNLSNTDSGVGIITGCNYSIINSTGGESIIPETELEIIAGVCQNTTFNLTGIDEDYNLTICANDSLNNWGCNFLTFGIRMQIPSVVLNSPTNDIYLNNGTNIYHNFTAGDSDGLKFCELWGNWSGWHKNYTWNEPTNNSMNYTIINLTEGKYIWNVNCSDNADNSAWALNNFTETIDLSNPNVLITTTNQTNFDSLSFNISYSIIDPNIDICYYTLRDSLGAVHNYPENTTLNCTNTQISLSTLAYGDYTIQIWGEDKVNHLNQSRISFTTESPAISPGGGGGGGVEVKSSTVCLTAIGNVTRVNDLQRCILYARIRESCNGKIDCKLNISNNPTKKLSEQDVKVNISELLNWFDKYNNHELEVIKMFDSDIKRYNLFTSIIQIETLKFSPNPARIDSFYFIFSKNIAEIYYPVKFNRLLKSVNFIQGGYSGFSGKVISNSTSAIYLNISDYSFIADTFVGTFEYTSQENETSFQEVQVRTFNFLNYWTWIISISIILIVTLIIIFRKRIKITFKKK